MVYFYDVAWEIHCVAFCVNLYQTDCNFNAASMLDTKSQI